MSFENFSQCVFKLNRMAARISSCRRSKLVVNYTVIHGFCCSALDVIHSYNPLHFFMSSGLQPSGSRR